MIKLQGKYNYILFLFKLRRRCLKDKPGDALYFIIVIKFIKKIITYKKVMNIDLEAKS